MIRPMRITIAQYSLSGCEGCALRLLNIITSNEKLIDHIELVSSRVMGIPEVRQADVAFVDGSVLRDNEEEFLMEIRSKSRILVALGTCSIMGGLNALRELYTVAELEEQVYGMKLNIGHLDSAKPLDSIVKVDYIIPGCPPPTWEIEEFLLCLLLGKEFRLTDRTVCFECTSQGLPCLLERGEVCFGPVIRGGCNAICPKYGIPCWGCRGIVEEYGMERLIENLRKHNVSPERVKEYIRIFLLKTKLRTLMR
ncbi:MAG: hypothetical protein DRN15_07730 [Thermoprotei archaeon]|nr:MAG: hypothetical protein DRM97_06260 [Thermoprotei archaeon]RLF22917.1 MAG: hypothetical protein DRN15_07730 [Thermoprotei archaeon]